MKPQVSIKTIKTKVPNNFPRIPHYLLKLGIANNYSLPGKKIKWPLVLTAVTSQKENVFLVHWVVFGFRVDTIYKTKKYIKFKDRMFQA